MNRFDLYLEIFRQTKNNYPKVIKSSLEEAFLGYYLSQWGLVCIDEYGDLQNLKMSDDDLIKGISPQLKVVDKDPFSYVIDFVIYCNSVSENCIKENNYTKHYLKDLYVPDLKNNPFKIAVELDGHDFHEKTKEQVIKRNRRDRELTKLGYQLYHISGSEFYHDVDGCISDLETFISFLANDFRNKK